MKKYYLEGNYILTDKEEKETIVYLIKNQAKVMLEIYDKLGYESIYYQE